MVCSKVGKDDIFLKDVIFLVENYNDFNIGFIFVNPSSNSSFVMFSGGLNLIDFSPQPSMSNLSFRHAALNLSRVSPSGKSKEHISPSPRAFEIKPGKSF